MQKKREIINTAAESHSLSAADSLSKKSLFLLGKSRDIGIKRGKKREEEA